MAARVLSSLAPARRRLVVALAGLTVLGVVAAVVLVVVDRGPDVDPVAQDEPGPVLLVPGYGGVDDRRWTCSREALGADGRDVRGRPAGRRRRPATCASRPPRWAEPSTEALAETGAPSVDVVGYSAGGVVARLYVADLGGGSPSGAARDAVGSPHHGTDLAALAVDSARTCPEACQQLAPDSDLLRGLNAGDETPGRPGVGGALDRGRPDRRPRRRPAALDGALEFAVQDVCPALTVGPPRRAPAHPAVLAHGGRPRSAPARPTVPGPEVCAAVLTLSR